MSPLYLMFVGLGGLHCLVYHRWRTELDQKERQLHQIKNRIQEIRSGLPTSPKNNPTPLGARPSKHDFDLRSVYSICADLDKPELRAARQSIIDMLGEEQRKSTFCTAKIQAQEGTSERIIESYPMAGIIGTLLSISTAAAVGSSDPETVTLAAAGILGSFSVAMGTTLVGLVFAVTLGIFLSPFVNRKTQELESLASKADEWSAALSEGLTRL